MTSAARPRLVTLIGKAGDCLSGGSVFSCPLCQSYLQHKHTLDVFCLSPAEVTEVHCSRSPSGPRLTAVLTEQPDIHIRVTTGSQETGKEETFPPPRGDHGGAAAVLRLNSSMETRMTDGLAEVLSRRLRAVASCRQREMPGSSSSCCGAPFPQQ
ncbi:unnamed protein product [Arctogadus glacialis]